MLDWLPLSRCITNVFYKTLVFRSIDPANIQSHFIIDITFCRVEEFFSLVFTILLSMPLLDAYEVSDHCYLPQSVDGIDCEPQQDLLEAIAVVGFSIKFPQDAVSPASFWSMLEERRCAMTTWPEDRINLDAFYHPDSDRRDTVRARLTSMRALADIKRYL
jgi:hypothetical protein